MHNERCTSGSEGGLEKPIGCKADRALRSDPTVERMTAAAERRDLFGGEKLPGIGFPPLKRRIRPIPPGRAAEAWLARFRALAGDRGAAGKAAANGAADIGSPDATAA